MSQVSRQRENGMLDVNILAIPFQQSMASEAVTQVMNPRGTTVNGTFPSQTITDLDEGSMHGVIV